MASPSADVAAKVPTGLIDQTNYVPRRTIVSIFLACAVVAFVALLGDNMIAVALPIIGADLGGGNQISWVATSFFVTSTAFQLLYGRLSDIWSRKTVLFALMFVFFIGNVGSAFATTFVQLVVFRAIAGIGGGGLPTIAQVIVSDTVSLRERGKYQGILGISVALANGVGPLVGGAFAQGSTWRWMFRLILPLIAISAVAVYLFMPLKPVEGDWKIKLRRIDIMGAVMILASSVLLVLKLSLTWAGVQYPWDDAHILVPLIVGLSTALAFLLWEGWRPKYPLLPLYIFRNRIVVGAAITQFINGWLGTVQLFYLPAYYQIAYGYSPVKSSVVLLSLTVIQSVVSSLSGLIITWTGRYRELILSGWAAWAIGLGLMATLTEDSSLGRQIGYSLFTGFGVGQTFQPQVLPQVSLVAVQGAVERKDMAVVTSMRSFVRNLGGTLGLAISGTILNNIFSAALLQSNLDASTYNSIVQNPIVMHKLLGSSQEQLTRAQEDYRQGFRMVFIIMASLAGLAWVISLVLMGHSTLTREDDERLKKEAKMRLEQMANKGEKVEKNSTSV